MVKKAQDLYREALALSEEERERLALLLYNTAPESAADAEWEQAWVEEAERRGRAVAEGQEQLIPGDQVMRELREILSK